MKMNSPALIKRFFLVTVANLLFLAFCTPANGTTEEEISKNFTVEPGGTLLVDVNMGSIKVSANAGNKVNIDCWRKIGRKSKSEEEAFLRENPIEISQEGNSVTVRCRTRSKMNWSFSLWGRNHTEAKYTITVPTKYGAALDTAGGSVSVDGLEGEVKAHTSGGSLQLTHIHGPVSARTAGGNIKMTACEGKLNIETSGGSIRAGEGSGSLNAETAGGSINVKKFEGRVHMHTSGGGLTIEEVAGELKGETAGGSIKAYLPAFAGPVDLKTSGGSITLDLPADAAFNVDAHTAGGSVSSDVPIAHEGKKERGRLKGTANGGGKLVRLDTSAGSIHIGKAERLAAEASRSENPKIEEPKPEGKPN